MQHTFLTDEANEMIAAVQDLKKSTRTRILRY